MLKKAQILQWIRQEVDRRIRIHCQALHQSVKVQPAEKQYPTLQEMLEYQAKNPELSCIDIPDIYKGYSDSGWIDTRGNPVVNWKLKLRTLARLQKNQNLPTPQSIHKYRPPCKRCGQGADFWATDDLSIKEWWCRNCQPKLYAKYPERRIE